MSTGNTRLVPIHVALCAAILVSVSWAALPEPPSQATRLAVWPQGVPSPRFRLVDTEGVPRTLSDYRGRIVVILFGFLHCPEVCPAELLKVAQVMRQLGPLAARVQVLFITLDPERDTPALLKSYVSGFDRRFAALTGTTAQVDEAASSFSVQYAHVPLDNSHTIDHSTATYLLDGEGHLRLIGAADSPVADFVHDIGVLASELREW